MSGRGEDTLAGTYAEALAEAAEGQGAAGAGALEAAGEELLAFAQVWRAQSAVRAFFLSGAVGRDAKHAAVDAAFGSRASERFTAFLHVLLRRGRMAIVPDVADAYRKILDARLGRVPVTLTTAAPMPAGSLQAITARLGAALGKTPVVTHEVRPALLGGAVLRVGDVVADGSVQRRLSELKTRIAHAGDLLTA